jgi:hypothetical protein
LGVLELGFASVVLSILMFGNFILVINAVDMGGFFGCHLNVGIGEILLLLFLAARLVGLLGFAVLVQLS